MKVPITVTFNIDTDKYPNWKGNITEYIACVILNDPENDFIEDDSLVVFKNEKHE